MSRKIHDATLGNRTVKVYHRPEWNEYVVRLFKDDVLYALSDYFTDDREDAMDTSKAMLKEQG